jgi:hypothetical protein
MSLTCLETVEKLKTLLARNLETEEKLKTLLARKLTIKEIRLLKFLIKNPYYNSPFDVPEETVFLADNLEGFLFKSKKSPKVTKKSLKSKSPKVTKKSLKSKSPKVTKKSVKKNTQEITFTFNVNVRNDDEKVDIKNNNAKEVETWYKQHINFYLKYNKNVKSITIKHVKGKPNEFTGVCVLYKNDSIATVKSELETMVINPDDDGNCLLKLNKKLNKKEYLVSGKKIVFLKNI